MQKFIKLVTITPVKELVQKNGFKDIFYDEIFDADFLCTQYMIYCCKRNTKFIFSSTMHIEIVIVGI